MGILDELGLNDPDALHNAIEDYFSDKLRAKKDLRLMLVDKIGLSKESITDGVLDIFLKRGAIRAILYGHIVSQAVIKGKGICSREAMDILGWVPNIDLSPEEQKLLEEVEGVGHQIILEALIGREGNV